MEIRQWLMEMKDQVAILTGALAIMHPDMYVTVREAMVQLGNWAKEQGKESMLNAITMWPTIYNVASVMVNQASPLHLDRNGWPQWLDLLMSVRDYSDLDFVIPTIGLWVCYNPSTILGLSGQLLEHSVGKVEGDRGIISLYMRDNVHEYMDVVCCNYMECSNIPGYM